MTAKEAAGAYRLPVRTTQEELERRWSRVLNYRGKILLAGHCCGGPASFGLSGG